MIVTFHYSKKISGFVKGSELIMWAEEEDFSHCATEIQVDPELDGIVYEAVYPKSRKLPKQEWLKHSQPVHSIPFLVTDPVLKKAIIFDLESNLDKDYSIFQLFIIGVGLCFKLVAKAVDKIVINSNKFLICSEYQSLPLKRLGAKFEEPSDSIDITECFEQAKKLKGIE